MTTWTLKRILVLLAAIAIGVFVLRQGFAGNASELVAGTSSPSSPHASPSTTRHSPSPRESPRRRAKIRGVVVQVVNGSGTTGLAASTSLVLKNQGYTLKAPGNLTGAGGASATTPATTIYYRADSLPEAQAIQKKFFPAAEVLPAPASYPADVQVTVVLGTDFAGIAPSP
jgi:hypothetical protein